MFPAETRSMAQLWFLKVFSKGSSEILFCSPDAMAERSDLSRDQGQITKNLWLHLNLSPLPFSLHLTSILPLLSVSWIPLLTMALHHYPACGSPLECQHLKSRRENCDLTPWLSLEVASCSHLVCLPL